MTLKQALAANRWLRAQLVCLIAVALCLPAMVVFRSAWVLLASVVSGLAGGACWMPARRLERDLKRAHERAAADARELHTPRAPEASPNQCPVCGMDDLDELARDDRFMERGERSKVVAYGRKRAHRDCAEFVPHQPTEADRRAERDAARVRQWRYEDEQAQRAFEDSWPELYSPAEAGALRIRLTRKPDPKFWHWMIAVGPMMHNDILTIKKCRADADGFGWVAVLTEPLRHALKPDGEFGHRLMPLDSEYLWNREAGRPATRTELGLCDCAGPVAANTLRASVEVDWRRLGQGFAVPPNNIWSGSAGWTE